MPSYQDKFISHHKAEDVFAIVADVESYPDFLPWVLATRITERGKDAIGNDYFIADLVAHYKSLSQKYTSRVTLIRPNESSKKDFYEIDVKLEKGPFKNLDTKWKFITLDNNNTEISFEMDFSFKSAILEKMIGHIFEYAASKMATAFKERVDSRL